MIIVIIILLFVACLVLVKGADLTIKALSFIAKRFGWPEFVASFFIMATATSLPELFVGISSALHKSPQLSLGNIIGANIINLTLILGLCAILAKKIKVEDGEEKKMSKQIIVALILGFLPVVLAADKEISRLDGIVLLLAFCLYIIYIFYGQKKIPRELRIKVGRGLTKNIFLFILGVLLLLGSSEAIIDLAQILTKGLNLPLLVIGLIIVALGTTMPEFIFGVRAAIKKHQELSLGDSLGTIVANSTLILGLVSLIYPIKIIYFFQFLIFSLFFLLAITIFYFFIKSKNELSWKEGIALVFFYVIFVIIQLI